MTKRITILAMTFMFGASDTAAAQPLYPGTTLEVDDKTAGELVVAGKARHDPEAKLKSTAKEHESDLDRRAALASLDPQEALAATLAKTIAREMAAAMKAAPADPAKV